MVFFTGKLTPRNTRSAGQERGGRCHILLPSVSCLECLRQVSCSSRSQTKFPPTRLTPPPVTTLYGNHADELLRLSRCGGCTPASAPRSALQPPDIDCSLHSPAMLAVRAMSRITGTMQFALLIHPPLPLDALMRRTRQSVHTVLRY